MPTEPSAIRFPACLSYRQKVIVHCAPFLSVAFFALHQILHLVQKTQELRVRFASTGLDFIGESKRWVLDWLSVKKLSFLL